MVKKREAGELLALSDRSIDRLAEAGELRKLRIGGAVRFLRADIEALIKRAVNDENPAGAPGLVTDSAEWGGGDEQG